MDGMTCLVLTWAFLGQSGPAHSDLAPTTAPARHSIGGSRGAFGGPTGAVAEPDAAALPTLAPGVAPAARDGAHVEPSPTATRSAPGAGSDLQSLRAGSEAARDSSDPASSGQPGAEPSAPKITPPEMVAAALKLPAESSLQGRQVTLLEMLGDTADRATQLEITLAYWRLAAAVAAHNWKHEESAWLEAVSAPSRDSIALHNLQTSAKAALRSAEVAAVKAQHELAEKASLAQGAELPLPADPPHIGVYHTHFDRLFAARIPPGRTRLLDRTLPVRCRAIDARATAVLAAQDAAVAAADACRAGRGDLATVLACHQQWSRQREALLESVFQYNREIAEYALAVAPPTVRGRALVAMLIMPSAISDRPLRPLPAGRADRADLVPDPAVEPATFNAPAAEAPQWTRPAPRGEPTLAPPRESLQPAPAPERSPVESELQPTPTPAPKLVPTPMPEEPTPAPPLESPTGTTVPLPGAKEAPPAPPRSEADTAPQTGSAIPRRWSVPGFEPTAEPVQAPDAAAAEAPRWDAFERRLASPASSVSNDTPNPAGLPSGSSVPEKPSSGRIEDPFALPTRIVPLRNTEPAAERGPAEAPSSSTEPSEEAAPTTRAARKPIDGAAAVASAGTTSALYAGLAELSGAVRAKQLAAALHWDRTGADDGAATVSLQECFRSLPAPRRREVIESYWDCRQDAAAQQAVAQQVEILRNLAPLALAARNRPLGAEAMLRLRAARTATDADLLDWQVRLLSSRYRLARRAGMALDAPWPVPDTAPHSGPYSMRLQARPEELLKSWPVRRSASLIPALYESLTQQADAVVEADLARASLTDAYQTGTRGLAEVLQTVRHQQEQTLAFLQTLTDYNQAIADYVSVVLPPDLPAETLVQTLVTVK